MSATYGREPLRVALVGRARPPRGRTARSRRRARARRSSRRSRARSSDAGSSGRAGPGRGSRSASPCRRRRGRSPARRADLELAELPLAGAVERHVPRHDQVGVARRGRRGRPSRGRGPRGGRARRSGPAGSTTQPAPIAQALPVMIPEGTARILYVSPSTTIVCPRWGRPGSGRRGRSPGRAGRRSCPCPRRPTAHRRSQWQARATV